MDLNKKNKKVGLIFVEFCPDSRYQDRNLEKLFIKKYHSKFYKIMFMMLILLTSLMVQSMIFKNIIIIMKKIKFTNELNDHDLKIWFKLFDLNYVK
ncbi:hypothetical protein BpHYR1_009208 [Brachionus plicatilis]|uniref:Uncharacterized protein n=1 Tax=Brachionus plicatilis TaxID=10195 RepID=A0A3M7PUQ4_BRAPC|nr:hypothetical protein BpHYR1_009208 [Brachionus plicatilis]